MIHIFVLVQVPSSTSHVCIWRSLVCGEVEPNEDMPWTWQESALPVSGASASRARGQRETREDHRRGAGNPPWGWWPLAEIWAHLPSQRVAALVLCWYQCSCCQTGCFQRPTLDVLLRRYNSPQGHKVSLSCWHQRGCPAGGEFNLFLICLIPDFSPGLPAQGWEEMQRVPGLWDACQGLRKIIDAQSSPRCFL